MHVDVDEIDLWKFISMYIIIFIALEMAIIEVVYFVLSAYKGIVVFIHYKIKSKQPYSKIEQNILPLVNKMNNTGLIHTVASCQGHTCVCYPYVYFDTTLEIASTIEQRLREASIRCEKWMSTGWEVKGCFNEEYKLVFLLYSPTHVENYFKLWWSTMQYFVKRRKLNKELLALANVIEQTILLKLGDRDKPCVYSNE